MEQPILFTDFDYLKLGVHFSNNRNSKCSTITGYLQPGIYI